MGVVEGDPQAYDHFNDRAVFEYRTSFIPRKCYKTNRLVWGVAIRARAVWTGPGSDVVEDRWYHKDEAIIMMLRHK